MDDLQVSQIANENESVRVNRQVAAEVLTTTDIPTSRVTQMTAEVLVHTNYASLAPSSPPTILVGVSDDL